VSRFEAAFAVELEKARYRPFIIIYAYFQQRKQEEKHYATPNVRPPPRMKQATCPSVPRKRRPKPRDHQPDPKSASQLYPPGYL